MMGNGMMGGGWGVLGGGVPMLLWWGLIILLVVLAVRWLAATGAGERPGGDSALAILRERYARGEISLEEFNARKRQLE